MTAVKEALDNFVKKFERTLCAQQTKLPVTKAAIMTIPLLNDRLKG